MQRDTWKRGPLRNVDGLGRNEHGAEIIVMEGSSGQTKEDVTHTKDDTWKNIHVSICVLESLLRQNPAARLSTAENLKAFSMQSVCSTITLSITTLDARNPGQYIHQECLQESPWVTVKGWIG